LRLPEFSVKVVRHTFELWKAVEKWGLAAAKRWEIGAAFRGTRLVGEGSEIKGGGQGNLATDGTFTVLSEM
jgi:hypothetical protein